MEVIVRPHVMSDRGIAQYASAPGQTIDQLIDTYTSFDSAVKSNLAVLVNGELETNWQRLPNMGDTVTIAARLHGGDGDSKQILGAIAMIVVAIFAPYAAPALGATLGVSTAVAQAGIMIIGSLAVNALFAPPKVAATPDRIAEEQGGSTYSFGSQGNQVRQFGTIPKVYGTHKVVPDLAGLPYTLNVGNDTYFYALYCFGYGGLHVEDFKIGQNPLGNYTDYDIRVHENFTDASQLELYKNDVWQDSYNAELTMAGGPVFVTTRPDTESAILDMIYPQGLADVQKDGSFYPLNSAHFVEYRDTLAAPGTPYANFQGVGPVNGIIPKVSRGILNFWHNILIDVLGTPTTGELWGDIKNSLGSSIPVGTNRFAVANWQNSDPPAPGTFISIGSYALIVDHVEGNQIYTTTGLPGKVKSYFNQRTGWVPLVMFVSDDLVSNGIWNIMNDRLGGFPASLDMTFPYKSIWEIRLTASSPDSTDDTKTINKRVVVALKSMKSIAPVKPEVPLTIVELKIRATGQLNGAVEEFSGVATSRLRAWKDGQWQQVLTGNPAWVYLDILTGPANPRAVSDDRVDVEKLKAWALKNEVIMPNFTEKNGECNVVIDRVYTMWELLQSVAATGRATPNMRDNKYSVIIDDETRTPVQMFSPRNSSNLQSNRTYIEGPHALRVKWIDPVANYTANAAMVYRTGYSENNATVFEDLDTFGITNQEAAVRYGRYMLAQGLLRQERFSIDTDVENIICLRGDLVYVAHDVVQVGGETSRIYAVDVDAKTIEIDSPINLQFADYEDVEGESHKYAVRVRRKTGQMTGLLYVHKLEGTTITLDTANSLTQIFPGDLLVYGEVESIVGQYTVSAIVPTADLAATIKLEEYAPLVYAAEFTGIFPNYEPQQGASYVRTGVNDLTGTIIEYVDDAQFPRCRIRLGWTPPQGTVLPLYYDVYNIRRDGSELYLGNTKDLGFVTDPIDMWILGGTTLTYAVRAFFESSGVSVAAFVEVPLPVRATVPPPNYDYFSVVALDSGLRQYNFGFTGDIPAHVIGGEIRYYPGHGEPGSWSSMTNLAGDDTTMPYATSGLELSGPPAGEWTFGIRAMDERRVLALDPLFFTITLGASINEGGSGADYTPPPTPTGFDVAPFFTRLLVQQDDPEYTMGGGHGSSVLYATEWDPASVDPLPTFESGSVVLLQEFLGNITQVAVEMSTSYRLWLKWKTRVGVESVVPAGGENGLLVRTGENVEKLLDVLTGQIRSEQLFGDLGARIDLIDADSDVPGSVNARVQALAVQTQTDIEAVAGQINTVQARIQLRPNLLPNGGFQRDFDGWTLPTVGTTSIVKDTWGTSAKIVSSALNGQMTSATFPVTPGEWYVLSGDTRMVPSPFSTVPRHQLILDYLDDTMNVLASVGLPNKAPQEFSYDPARRIELSKESQAPVGATMARVRFAWVNVAATTLTLGVRYVKTEMGRMPASGYSDESTLNAIAASVKTEQTARATADGLLQAQYTVKVDLNGYVTGYGLASTVNNGVPSSSFAIRADTFYIANPEGPGIAPSMPFIVRTADSTIGGEFVPKGVYMRDAYIQNGTITNAKIANASIQDAKIINLSAAKINTGFLSSDRIEAGSITADKISLGTGKNLLSNSSWLTRGAYGGVPIGWAGVSNMSPSEYTFQEVEDGGTYTAWVPKGAHGEVMFQNVGRLNSGDPYGRYMYLISDLIPVESTKRYEGSAYAGAHRCTVSTVIVWYDANEAQIGSSQEQPNADMAYNRSGLAGGKALSSFKRIGCFGFAPVNAAYARLQILKSDTDVGQANSYAFTLKPMFAQATGAQRDLSFYEDSGATTVITASGISTPNLSSITGQMGLLTAGAINLQGDGGAGYGYIRSFGKWWRDGQIGWMAARQGADGNVLFEVFGGNNCQIWLSGHGDCGIAFPGILMTQGGLTIGQIDVIDTLNIRGNAVTVPAFVDCAGNQIGVAPINGTTRAGEQTIMNVNGFNSGGSPIFANVTGSWHSAGGADMGLNIRLYRNGGLIQEKFLNMGQCKTAQFWFAGSGYANYQFNAYAYTTGADIAVNDYTSVWMMAARR